MKWSFPVDMDAGAVEWKSLIPWGYLINLSISDELAMCPLTETFFFLLRVIWNITFSDGVLSLYSFFLPGFFFFFSDDSHSKNTCLHLLSLPILLHFFSIFSGLSVWFTWVFPHSSLNLGLCRAFLRGHLWVSLSRSVLQLTSTILSASVTTR